MTPPRHVPAAPEFRAAIANWQHAQAEHSAACARLQASGLHLSPGLEALIDDVQMKGLLVDLALRKIVEASCAEL